MSHIYQMKNRSTMIETKARHLYNQLQKKRETGEIRSRAAYYNEVIQALKQFYASVDKPTFRVREATYLPYSEEYNAMLHEIHHDLSTLFTEAQHIERMLDDLHEHMAIDQDTLTNRLKKIEDNLLVIEAQFQKEEQELVFREGFTDNQYFDQDMVTLEPATITTQDGVLTLKPTSVQRYVEGATVRIAAGTGLPGNTKEIYLLKGSIHFIGEDGLHINPAHILDGNTNTWFEYETFRVNELDYEKAAERGFAYEEGIRWISNAGEELRLTLEIELPFIQTINWFSLNPFIPNKKVASPAIIESIQITDGKGQTREILATAETFENEKIYIFPQQPCKKIFIHLYQPAGYDTDIGHLFFKQLEDTDINVFDTIEEKEGRRVDGPYPSIENLDMQYDPKTKSIFHAGIKQGEEIQGMEERKNNLFALPATTGNVEAGFEVMRAQRFMIGIREAGIANYEFEEQSEYISHNFYSPVPIKGIYLTTEDMVPPIFQESPTDTPWIQYFISVDNGNKWHRIAPQGTIEEDVKLMYILNSNTPQEGRIDAFGYIDQTEDIHQVRVRIVLSRPTDIPNHAFYTPYVKDYRLHLITEGSELDGN